MEQMINMQATLSSVKWKSPNKEVGKEMLADVKRKELNTEEKNVLFVFWHRVALLSQRWRRGSDPWLR